MVLMSSILTAQEGIRFVDGSLAAVMSIAKERNKNVFIDTYADWCVPCKRMEEKFKNKDVADFFNEHFINYRINMQNPTRAAEIRRKYDVVFLPTMYILDPNGLIKYQVDKELTVSELLNAGQASLDPTSYFVSDATAVRRKDGTISGNKRPKTTTSTEIKKTPKSIEVAKVKTKPSNQTNTRPTTKPATKPIDTATGNISISAATRRAKILDSYETVEGSSQKVLAVLGEGEMPPEVLRQEAYLRLEFMDGSSNAAAQKYLATQSDWNTTENRKFIMDFLNSTFSDEYQFVVEHKGDFINQFGESKVNRSLEVLTYRTLHNAVPRPSLEEAIELYGNISPTDHIKKGNHYYVNRLIAEGSTDEVQKISKSYLKDNNDDHEMMYSVARHIGSKKNSTEEELEQAVDLMEMAVKIVPKHLVYLDFLGNVYLNLKRSKKAKSIFQKAAKVAKEQGKDSKKYEEQGSALDR